MREEDIKKIIKVHAVHYNWVFDRPRLIRINPEDKSCVNESFHLLPSISFNYATDRLFPPYMSEKYLSHFKVCIDFLCFHTQLIMFRDIEYSIDREAERRIVEAMYEDIDQRMSIY